MLRLLKHPCLALVGACMLAVILLLLPLRLPIGPNFWDLYFHLDAAYRISVGQVPHVDFFAPAGPLPFYGLSAMQALFPGAAPLLQAQYSILFPASLLLFGVTLKLEPSIRAFGWLVVVPFAAFSLLPFNTGFFFPAPGADGLGLYNRQTGLVLYVLVAAFWVMQKGWLRAAIIGLCLAMLLFMKLNAFAAGFLMLAVFVISASVRLRELVLILALVLLAIGFAQLQDGLALAYFRDLGAMIAHNAGGGAKRLLTLLSVRFDVAAPLLILVFALLWFERGLIRNALQAGWRFATEGASLASVRLAALGGLMLIFESQNTGGQDFLPLWPALVFALASFWSVPFSRMRIAILSLVAALGLPSFVHVVQAAARASVAAPGYAVIVAPDTEAAGFYATKPDYWRRAEIMLAHYAANREPYRQLSAQNEMPDTILYSTPDYQALYLLDLSQGLAALVAHEGQSGRRYQSIATLDANDLLPMLLKREPVKGITVSFDPVRGYPSSEYTRYAQSLQAADAILVPHCPETPARRTIRSVAQPALEGRQSIMLSPCWELFAVPH
jgi:hypothetical protein